MSELTNILRKVLPDPVVDEYLRTGGVEPRHHESITVMFLDIVNFTSITESLNAHELVAILKEYYGLFDQILAKYEVRKVKCIGDAYLCVSGWVESKTEHPSMMVLASLEIQRLTQSLKAHKIAHSLPYLEVRIGINTGEAISGVLDENCLTFDVWGSAVNLAKRMEQNGERGEVTVSGNSWKHLWPFFDSNFNQTVNVKGFGEVQLLRINALKQKFNKLFKDEGVPSVFLRRVKNHLLLKERYEELERDIIHKMEQGLSSELRYHSVEHTLEVLENIDKLVKHDISINDKQYLILKTAALFHDFGYLKSEDDHEIKSAELCRNLLPEYGYNSEDIEMVCETIMATKLNTSVNNTLQRTIVDADLYYLGTDKYNERAHDYRKELEYQGMAFEEEDWIQFQIDFLKQHQYYTEYGKTYLEKGKQAVILELHKSLNSLRRKGA